MANIIPPPLPPPPPRLSINPLIQPPNSVVKNAAVVTKVVPPASQGPAPTRAPKKPYITIKNLTTVVDASIGRHVDDLDEPSRAFHASTRVEFTLKAPSTSSCEAA